jgi:hypothetical protein
MELVGVDMVASFFWGAVQLAKVTHNHANKIRFMKER